jgi:general L-amino acid transport system substrate-binding protein
MSKLFQLILALAVTGLAAGSAAATTLDDVKAQGVVRCGVNEGLVGFAARDDSGTWGGFDVDFCKAVAAAVLGDPNAVEFMPLSTTDRFDALKNGKVDLLVRNTTWTMSRETELDLAFGFVNYYDGQGFMVRRDDGFTSALDMSVATVCVATGTTTEANLVNYFELNKMQLEVITLDGADEALAAYDSGDCDAYTTDSSALYSYRLSLTTPDDHFILPEIISKEPLGPVVRQGDEEWSNIVKWVGFALLNAEELGVKQENVDNMKASDNQDIRILLDVDGGLGESLGLGSDWVVNVLKAVGNYGEIFKRNIGTDSDLQIARGLNALWTRGGIQYAPPVR